ncbi:MAG: chaperone protein DnaK [Candidatus Parcubacteria bacterium]|nr:MAG: chaperone protein DnaK [Candidatus Parcubacteria bacterium]
MGKILGIDLGTTNSVAAIVEAGNPRVIENQEGARITPSVVAISKNGERLVGILAKRQAITNPQNTIFSIKRLIGRRFTDSEVEKAKKILPYEIRESQNGGVEVKMGDRWYRPEEISAMILQKIKMDVENKLGEKITEVVITVPAYFDDSQRSATKAAGEIAGLNVKRILPEPTAAALAYGLDKNVNQKILVYDFGGGTFDVSILEIGDNVIETKGIGGDTLLGGDDFDQRIIHYIIEEYNKQEGIDLSKDPLALQRLKEAAEKAKQELSTLLETEINLPFISAEGGNPKHLYLKLTRSQLENLTRDLVDKSIEIVDKTLKEVNLSPNDIDEIILVGGQTRMPLIQQKIREYFNKEPRKDINPDEVVAIGAAIQAGILQGDVREILLLDVTPLTLAIETLGGIAHPMIPKNTPIPYSKTEVFTTAEDNQTAVEIHVVQGERPMARDNKTLARFILDGIPPAPRGIPQIEVVFDIDVNGILTVTAKDKATNKTQSVKIESSTNLSKEDIEKLKREAEIYAEEDTKRRKLAETKNQAENLIYQARKILTDYRDKINEEIKVDIENKIRELEEAKNSDNIELIETKIKELTNSLSKIGQQFYNQNPDQNI